MGGAATGTGLTALTSEPLAGGPLGAAATHVFQRVGVALRDRLNTPQWIRADRALSVAYEAIQERLAAGEQLRDDGFFEEVGGGRRAGEELLEGVLLQAADSYEERKVFYIGQMYSSLAFRSDVSTGQAHMLLRLAERLSYQQLVCLAFFAEKAESTELSHLDAEREYRKFPRLRGGIAREIEQMGDLYLIGIRQKAGGLVRPSTTIDGGNMDKLHLGNLRLQAEGELLYDLMKLASIPDTDKAQFMGDLRASLTNEQ